MKHVMKFLKDLTSAFVLIYPLQAADNSPKCSRPTPLDFAHGLPANLPHKHRIYTSPSTFSSTLSDNAKWDVRAISLIALWTIATHGAAESQENFIPAPIAKYGEWTVFASKLGEDRVLQAEFLTEDGTSLNYVCATERQRCHWMVALPRGCRAGSPVPIGFTNDSGLSVRTGTCTSINGGPSFLVLQDSYGTIIELMSGTSSLGLLLIDDSGKEFRYTLSVKGLDEAIRMTEREARVGSTSTRSSKASTDTETSLAPSASPQARKSWEEERLLNGPTGTIETSTGTYRVLRFGTVNQPHPLSFGSMSGTTPQATASVDFLHDSSEARLTLRNGEKKVVNQGHIFYRTGPIAWSTYGKYPGMAIVIKDPETGKPRELFFSNFRGIKRITFDPPEKWRGKSSSML